MRSRYTAYATGAIDYLVETHDPGKEEIDREAIARWSREAEWLGLAKEYMRFAEGANDHLFRLLRAGKVGWAASLLHTLTGEPKYRAMALRVGDRLIETQSGDGSWIPGEKYQNDFTAELVV